MGTKANPGKFDAYAAAADDEPIFVLLGRDKCAPILVKIWAELRKRTGEDPAKCAEAEACAGEMVKWYLSLGKDEKLMAESGSLLGDVLADYGAALAISPAKALAPKPGA